MKKILYLAAIIGIVLPAATSCIRDTGRLCFDTGHDTGTVYQLNVSQDLLDLCDIVVSYKEVSNLHLEGVMYTEKDTVTEWEKLVWSDIPCFNSWLGYELKLKPGVQLTKEEYDLYMFYRISTTGDGAQDTLINRKVPRAQLASILDTLNSKGKPIISLMIKPGSTEVGIGDLEDVQNYEQYHYKNTSYYDTTELVEEEPIILDNE